MGTQSNLKPSLVLGAWAFLAVTIVGAAIVVFQWNGIRIQAEEDAAATTSSAIQPVLAQEAGGLSEPELASFSDTASGLLGDSVLAIRLWSSDGRMLASTAGYDGPAESGVLAQAAEGDLSAFKRRSPQGDLLVSYAPLGPGAVLEVQQDYGPVADSVARSRLILLLLSAGGGVVLLFLLPIVLWVASRGVRRTYDRLSYLYRTGQALRSSLDLTDVLGQLARDTALYTRAQLGIATLLEEESNDLILKASFEQEGNTAAQHHRKVEEWFLRRCAATGETVLAREDRFPYDSLLGHHPDRQHPVFILSVPILGRERTIGVITVVRRRAQGGLSSLEVRMVEEMAAQAAMAVEQAVLFAKVRSHASEVELSYDATLKVLMAALDTKDAVTQGHSERVSRLTGAVAREIGIPKERLVDIERGALLHDVGKIGVPDEVLRKEAALNEREWEAMQKHPLLAGLMVSKVGFLERALPILLYHHERYDGSGYPFGLQGEAIPLEARIFAVVDSYDAMTSDRPYRKAIPPEEALQEIKRNAGIQFDPQVVEAFMRVIARMQPVQEKAA